MIDLGAALKAVGGAKTGIAPVSLLDVLDVNGNAYYWSDRPINAPTVLSSFVAPATPGFPLTPPVPLAPGQYAVWSFPTEGGQNGEAAASIRPGAASGYVNMTFDGPFTAPNDVIFSNFQPSTLPPGAIVDSCDLVVKYQCTHAPSSTGISLSDGAGTAYAPVTLSPALVCDFRYWDTVSTFEISTFLGYHHEACTIYAIGICTVYHLPAAAGSGGGGGGGGTVGAGYGQYQPWILSVPQLKFNRSLQADIGKFVLQNLSGDTLSRDFEKIMRRSALEGAFFIYRLWQPDVRASWVEMHGTFTVDGVSVDTVSLHGAQLLNPAQQNTPLEIYSETCQLQWGGQRCGATGSTECKYSFQTCQVVERIMVALNDYEKNYGEANANLVVNPVNRRRKF